MRERNKEIKVVAAVEKNKYINEWNTRSIKKTGWSQVCFSKAKELLTADQLFLKNLTVCFYLE